MLSNRASAQRSRQRRQERLDQLEVLVSVARLPWQICLLNMGDWNFQALMNAVEVKAFPNFHLKLYD